MYMSMFLRIYANCLHSSAHAHVFMYVHILGLFFQHVPVQTHAHLLAPTRPHHREHVKSHVEHKHPNMHRNTDIVTQTPRHSNTTQTDTPPPTHRKRDLTTHTDIYIHIYTHRHPHPAPKNSTSLHQFSAYINQAQEQL